MTSRLLVDKIEGKSTTASLDLSAVTNLQMPSGHVIQTVFVHSTTRTAISSSSYTATALQKAITPKFSNSLIYVQVSSGYNTEGANNRIDITVQRSATGLTTINLHEDQGLSGSSDRMTTFKLMEIEMKVLLF